HLGWVVKAVFRSPLAIRYSLPFYQSLIASRHSPFTIRYSPFAIRRRSRFGRNLALPLHSVPRPTPLVPLKVGTQFLRHQLRTEVRSMDDLFCADGSLWCKTANETFRILSQAVYMLSGLR
ncbi:MAG: hypothetical protein LASZOEIN_001366, partial [Candidatus Fervidibacter sp.]